ncbi:MAG: DnaJ domain-containing protein [Alphaproteobacteria bacterium]
MAAAFLIGLVLVALAASALALTPPTRVGAIASLVRMIAAFLLIGLGVFVETRGLTLPALVLVGAGGYLIVRQRMKSRRAAGEGAAQGNRSSATGGPMSREEALAVLGLSPGASEADIRRAYHDLIQKIHPDHGGSSYLATKLNVARDTLLRHGSTPSP